jgi:hypothetical protein
VFRTNLPVYDTPRHWMTMAYCTSCLTGPKDASRALMTWGGEGDMVISCGMHGEAELNGKPAVLQSRIGQGRVISYNFNGIHRDMNRGDYRQVWNAILNCNALP